MRVGGVGGRASSGELWLAKAGALPSPLCSLSCDSCEKPPELPKGPPSATSRSESVIGIFPGVHEAFFAGNTKNTAGRDYLAGRGSATSNNFKRTFDSCLCKLGSELDVITGRIEGRDLVKRIGMLASPTGFEPVLPP